MLSMDQSTSVPCFQKWGISGTGTTCRNPQGGPVYMSPASWSCGYTICTLDHGGTVFSMYIYHCALKVYFVTWEGSHA